jgi:hypothetical protein
MEDKICGVYKVTNKVNDKIYIGQSIDIERRWNQHKYGKGSLLLRNAIRKYGLENFSFEIIEKFEIESKDELINILLEAEQKWLNFYKSYNNESGYNLNRLSKPNHTKKRDEDFRKKISIIKIENNHCGKGVIQYDHNGKVVKNWKSAAQIERELKLKAENISACCLGKQKTCGGYIWVFEENGIDEDFIISRLNKHRPRKKIHKLSIAGVVVDTYNSIAEAAKSVNGNSANITHVCKGRHKSYRGFKWAYVCPTPLPVSSAI